jgi:hypothetical protein
LIDKHHVPVSSKTSIHSKESFRDESSNVED